MLTKPPKPRLLFVVNVDWFFLSHRLPIARQALAQGFEVHIATTLTHGHDELVAHGLVVHPIQLQRGSSGLGSAVRAFRDMLAVMRRTRPDIVHLVTIQPVLLGGIAARLARVPAMVAAISGLGFVFLARGWRAAARRVAIRLLYRLALGHPNSKVIFQNENDRQTVSQLAGLADVSSVLIRGSGVSLDAFQPSPLPEGPPVVMLAARLLSDKGVREFVDAARALRRQVPTDQLAPRFVLVGDTDADNPASLARAELERWQAEGVVELWGQRDDMPAVLAQATVVVLPSYREGLPKVLIEAAAAGRPVVTTDVPGCRDAITPGVTGLLVPPKNAAALAEAIHTLLRDRDRCARMGAAGRVLAEQAFDVNRVVAQHLAVYRGLLHEAQQP